MSGLTEQDYFLATHRHDKLVEMDQLFLAGIEKMFDRCTSSSQRGNGIKKLWDLRASYVREIMAAKTSDQVKDISICFHCFDKKQEGECTDCD